MKENILIFDIDGTLCDINKDINLTLLQTIKDISKKQQIVFSSGKPCGYIAGFVRQLQIQDCIIVGENGANIMFDSYFPPKKYYKIEVKEDIQKIFLNIKKEYSETFNDTIWFQPNDINVTVFPLDLNNIKKIHEFAKKYKNKNINIYYHKDSVDFTPKGFDKGTAVDILLETLNYNKTQLFVFGDGENDIPMFEKTKNKIVVKNKELPALIKVENYKELNDYLIKAFK